MLVVDDQLLMCIEAKFCSGNPLAHAREVAKGEKPTDRAGLLAKYYKNAGTESRKAINPGAIGEVLHSQLFRNVVFASEMAPQVGGRTAWHVVNLVSSTQATGRKESPEYSFLNAEQNVRSYLDDAHQDRFSSRTWEDLHHDLIRDDPDLADLNAYMSGKSAHFLPAFKLNQAARP
jgi:hypothetical protein